MIDRFFRKSFRRHVLTVMSGLLFLTAMVAVSPSANALLVLGSVIFIGPDGGAKTYKIKNTNKKESKAYRVEWTQLRQMPTGAKKAVQPGEIIPNVRPAEPYMYVAPRRVMLQPDQLQHLRFMVRRTENMEPGEYRSYIYLEPEQIPDAYSASAGEKKDKSSPAKGASGSLSMLTGYRIPVVFLHGSTTLETGANSVQFVPNKHGTADLHFNFTRQGTRSAIGEINVICSTPQGEVRITGSNIKVFTELNEKHFSYPFNPPAEGCSQVAIDFLPHSEDPDFERGPQRLAMVPVR